MWVHLTNVLQQFQAFKIRSHLRQLSCRSKRSMGFHCSQGRSSTSRLLQSDQSPGCSCMNNLLQLIIKQMKTIKLIQRPIKSLYLTPDSKLMVPRSTPTTPNLK